MQDIRLELLLIVINEKNKANKLELFINNLETIANNYKNWNVVFTKEICGTFTRMVDLWEDLILLDYQIGKQEESL